MNGTNIAIFFIPRPGVDVVITIFCDICHVSAQNGVLLKTNVMIQILQNLAVV
jgi:hypothetical protein